MIKRGFVINPGSYELEYDGKAVEYDDTRIEGMWYHVKTPNGKQMLPVAYVFPEESKVAVQVLLNELKYARKVYDDKVADTFYKEFPKLR